MALYAQITQEGPHLSLVRIRDLQQMFVVPMITAQTIH